MPEETHHAIRQIFKIYFKLWDRSLAAASQHSPIDFNTTTLIDTNEGSVPVILGNYFLCFIYLFCPFSLYL